MARVKLTDAVFGRQSTGVAVLLDGASVQINIAGGSAATVYQAASGGTTITNPVTSTNGRLPGYVDEGSYQMVVTYSGVTATPVPFEARAAYPSGAADGQVLTYSSASSGVVWSDPNAISANLPWKIDLNVFTTAATNTNWATLTATASVLMGGTRSSSGAQNAEVGWDVILAAGTWTLEVFGVTGSGSGIITATLDGNSVGTMDQYSASTVNNVSKTITSITVATGGKKRLLLKLATKNASSSSYIGSLQVVSLLRTA